MTLPDCAALGTMHGKAAAIAPPLARIGITLVVPIGLDTDRFGTFTPEIPRAGTMEEAARAKAHAAIAATGLSCGMASEGAYGAHPFIHFLPIGREVLLWYNSETGQKVVERLTDNTPCYDNATVCSGDEVTAFLKRIDFPQTAVIVAATGDGAPTLAKGLQDRAAVDEAVARAAHLSVQGSAFLQTDMRAHLNARRMETIGRLAERLAARLATACPACCAPGCPARAYALRVPCEHGCGGRDGPDADRCLGQHLSLLPDGDHAGPLRRLVPRPGMGPDRPAREDPGRLVRHRSRRERRQVRHPDAEGAAGL